MLLSTVLDFYISALFTHTVNPILLNTRYEGLSLFVAIIIIIIYVLNRFFSFKTHKYLYLIIEDPIEHSPKWSLQKSLLVLVIAIILMAIESEFLVGSIKSITKRLDFSNFFIGIILIPIIRNATEYSSAVVMSRKNKMDVVLEIATESRLQIILFVASLGFTLFPYEHHL